MNTAVWIADIDEEIDRLTQVRSLLAHGTPSSTASLPKTKAHGLEVVPGGKKVDRRKGKRSPAVIARMREAQRRRYASM